MPLTVKHEEVSPQLAHQYLGMSSGNRSINADSVLSLAVAMETGRWDADASELVFDDSGALVDGHHRLHAVAAYDKPVRMLVKRGVSKSARGVIDTGRSRNIADLFNMYRPDSGQYITQKKSALASCIELLVPGRPPVIRTLDAFDAWMRQFHEGIAAVFAIVSKAEARQFRKGPITGAFAFAHKINPRKVEAFLVRMVEGVNLRKNEPALTLRSFLSSSTPTGRRAVAERRVASRKVLSAIHAELRGLDYGKVQSGATAVAYFRTAYDAKATERLVGLWTHPAVEAEH